MKQDEFVEIEGEKCRIKTTVTDTETDTGIIFLEKEIRQALDAIAFVEARGQTLISTLKFILNRSIQK